MTFGMAIRHGFSRLLRFGGRDARSAFWPFALAVVILGQIIGFVLVLPIILQPFLRLQRFSADRSAHVSTTFAFGQYSTIFRGTPTDLMPDFSAFLFVILGVAVGTVLLLSAAVVRRLHDIGRSGWWGLMPLPFLFGGLIVFKIVFADFGSGSLANAQPSPVLFLLLFANNLLYLAVLGLLIAWLATGSQQTANRYGPTA